MKNKVQELAEISRFFGKDKEAVIAGGGNTSFKDKKHIWVKASGVSLADITPDGFVKLNRERLQKVAKKQYSENINEREQQVKEDLSSSKTDISSPLRPSVETNMHEILGYSFVVHLHPTFMNALLCSKKSKQITRELFGEEVLYITYTDPGYVLFKKVESAVEKYRKKFTHDPKLLFLENHGIFISADSIQEIRELYTYVLNKINSNISSNTKWAELPVDKNITEILPALRMILSKDSLKVLKVRHNELISHFYKNKETFTLINRPFTPDMIVYCKADYLYISQSGSPEKIIAALELAVKSFIEKKGYAPKIILIKNIGLIAADDDVQSCEILLDIFEDLMKISYLSDNFGGPRFLTRENIQFIENWEIENYRRKISRGSGLEGKVKGKIAIVTGGAMGFGAGIAEDLMKQGANVIVADVNEDEGPRTIDNLNKISKRNKAYFVKTDVSDPESVANLIQETVMLFGGLDIMVSNAGILYAGSLEEMDYPNFERMTRINYSAYFLCAQSASQIMKLQYRYNRDYYADIIQINSKSGLKGSNKNFAYAGGKFGGIGLTQSFALELMPFNIKVNSICPGNFFDGPLWSDPKKGLFIQYLKTGKVSGAKTIEDVKKHYEEQVPAGRGCRVEDVMKALYYVIEQQYETGQAIPVTGGQIMLH